MNIYDKVILVGRTQLLRECYRIFEKRVPQNIIEILDVSVDKMNYLQRTIPTEAHYRKMDRENVMEYLKRVSQKTLILSIMNPFLFPGSVIENQALTIINLHHALLPNHPGRNAEAWTIYEGDLEAGITWHYVDTGIDTGKILFQKKLILDEQITSFQLYQKLNTLAVSSLEEHVCEVISGKIVGKKQESGKIYQTRSAKERPNNGVLELEWNSSKISAFLRSMDYGVLRVLGCPYLKYGEEEFLCKSYKIIPNKDERFGVYMHENHLYCNKGLVTFQFKLHKMEETK